MYSGRHADFVVKQLLHSLIAWRAKVVGRNGGRVNPEVARINVACSLELGYFFATTINGLRLSVVHFIRRPFA